ncbi:MAG: spore coat protein [Ignavibacteriae bacterium HGW-Ignavibacteriae-2]|jgi:spore coat protein CotH|nr:CotH kinase family protein [Bacteroidota bacterium]PKL88295.1 MAG: spore coat protein [Ignavibacteriae bacterium HGW-Ignavibacteriae-2]
MITIKSKLVLMFMLTVLLTNCKEDISSADEETGDIEYTTNLNISDWSEATHGKSGKTNYDIVFPQNKVNRIDFVISANNWKVMLADMALNYGTFGSGAGGPADDSDDNPIYVPCSLYFNNIQWYEAGIRFKGNSSLKTTWGSGIWKLPLRLNMDRFEDIYPEITNQRFYGFKELSLSNCYDDESLIREKVAPEIFRDFGIAAPQTAFYRIYIDYGNGPIYFGLYTMIEIVDDTMIEDQFAEDDGNLYKPEGIGASFAKNTFSTSYFEKKSNEETDWSDVEALYNILHSSQRTSEPDIWRTSLEKILNVDHFLKWLAVNTTIQNWDTYGNMTHNYYLYNNPKTNLLTWIPWDNNEAFQSGKQSGALSISCSEVGSSWPLIRYLLDNSVYSAKYKTYLSQVITSAFEPSKMISKYQNYSSLIKEYAVGSNGEQKGYTFLESDSDFDSAISQLISHVNSRYNVVQNYIK